MWFDQVVAKAAATGSLAELDTLPDHVDVPFEGYTLTGKQPMDGIEHAVRSAGLGGAAPFKRAGVPWPLSRAMSWVSPLWREMLEMRCLWPTPHGLGGRPLARLLPAFRATPLPTALRASLAEVGIAKPSVIPREAAPAVA